MDKQIPRLIAENIRKYREMCNMTQAEMSEKLKIDAQYYAQLEQGRRNFNVNRIVDSCKVLQVRIEDIIPIDNSIPEDEEKLEREFQLKKLNALLNNVSSKQLKILIKFIEEILPFV